MLTEQSSLHSSMRLW